MTIASFGYNRENSIPSEVEYANSVKAFQWKVAGGAIGGVVGVSAIAVAAITCPFIVPIVISGLLIGATAVGFTADKLMRYREICRTAGIIFNKDSVGKISNPAGRCDMIAAAHSAETELWRERMIASAEHNIVLSGNYCGGKAFDRMIAQIERRLEEKPDLKVIVISSPKFLKKSHYKKFKDLEKEYEGNVSLIESPDIWHISPGLKKSTNHTKVFVTDYGRYWIQGGSGVKDNFVQPGVDDLSRAQFRGEEEPVVVRDTSLLGRFLPRSFRDQDFMGKSAVGRDTVGTQTYIQALLLANQWNERNQRLKGKKPTRFSADEIGLLTGAATEVKPGESLARRMLREVLPPAGTVYPTIAEFESDERKAADVDVQVFAQGPGHSESPFAQQLIQKIENAEREISLNHMYIHPTQEIFDALVRAANRGVKITIITNGAYGAASTPSSHYFFAARNRFNYSALVKATEERYRANIEVYEFRQHKKGNHKKVAVIDDTVIAGSSNLGLKSTKWSSDDEMNFVATSPALAGRVREIFRVDISKSTRVTTFDQTARQVLDAAHQRALAPLID
jgi:HKD family nuclease